MNEMRLNKARLNVVSLNKALINGAVERHGSSAGGGGAPSKYIRFADPAVEAVLMANGVSSDGVGITKEDAAAVTSIGTWFKGNTEITSFDEFRFFGVNSLSIQSFYGCTSLKSIVIPASVSEIPSYGVFQNCTSLQRVTFNGDIAGIYNEAFLGCSALSDINIPESVAGFGNSAFNGCTNMRIHLYLPNLITDSQWSTSRVFANTGILSVNLPNVQKLGGDFFAGSRELVKVDIGASAVSIGSSLCNGCTSLTTLICRAVTPPSIGNNIIANAPNAYIYVPDASVEAYKTATNWSSYADRIHPLSELEGSPYITFADAEVERVLMENNVSSDGVGITMADAEAVTNIGTWFKGNTAITSFNELALFVNVQTLSAYAFANCTALASIDLANVTAIQNNAFEYCSSLSYVGSLAKVTALLGNAFRDCANLKQEIEMPMLTEITSGDGQFRGAGITSFTARNLKNISLYMFYSCVNLKNVRLQAVETITNMAFANCTALEYIIIDNAVVPTLSHSNAFNKTNNCPIYVPDASVDAYKTASADWSTHASRIKPLSEYVES